MQGITVNLAPGQAKKISYGTKAVDNPGVGRRVGVRYNDQQIRVEQCMGTIDAIPYVQYTAKTEAFDNTSTLYGEIVKVGY